MSEEKRNVFVSIVGSVPERVKSNYYTGDTLGVSIVCRGALDSVFDIDPAVSIKANFFGEDSDEPLLSLVMEDFVLGKSKRLFDEELITGVTDKKDEIHIDYTGDAFNSYEGLVTYDVEVHIYGKIYTVLNSYFYNINIKTV